MDFFIEGGLISTLALYEHFSALVRKKVSTKCSLLLILERCLRKKHTCGLLFAKPSYTYL